MKKLLYILLPALFAASCASMSENTFYGESLCLSVRALYPSSYSEYAREGVPVRISNYNTGDKYTALTDASGVAKAVLPKGIYRVSVSDRDGQSVFNGLQDNVILSTTDLSVDLELAYSKSGEILIKEIYCGGCSKAPEEGTYQSDSYVIIHNNCPTVQYLDGLCFGTLAPYNSTSSTPAWNSDGSLPDFAPVIQAVWRFGGSGTSFPLGSGADAVICLRGAVDHTVSYPLSVNLNNPDYFVCYNPNYFNNPIYHPAPGPAIQNDHILNVEVKMGQANAYTFSINSPAVILFRPSDEGIFKQDNLLTIPGQSADKVVKVPFDDIVDGVEVWNGSSSVNHKRMTTAVDAGYATLSVTFQSRTLMRKIDEMASEAAGFEMLQDTNNSTNDFYERETQSLHK